MCDVCRARIDAALSQASVADVLAFEQFVDGLTQRQHQTLLRGLWCSDVIEDQHDKGFEEGEQSAEFEWKRQLEPICRAMETAMAKLLIANPPTDSPEGELNRAIIKLRGLL